MSRLSFISSESKRDLLILLKRAGSISLDLAEKETGLSRTTLREHLRQLERDGLIRRTYRRYGRGRPSVHFHLTENGEALFPTRDGLLLRRLLRFLEEENRTDLIERFFDVFWNERRREFALRCEAEGATGLTDRARVLEDMLTDQGFMPEVVIQDDEVMIRECNCPFPEAVKHTRLPCRLEAEFFEEVFDASIGRLAYIPEGSPACTYRTHQD